MDTIQIINAMNMKKVTKQIFKGVYASNKLPKQKIKIKPACYIINTDPSTKPGTHWVAIYLPKNGKAEYFDSFGYEPKVKSIQKFLKRNSVNFIYNPNQLQSPLSFVCGNYCCEYLLHKCQKKSNKSFFKKYYANDPIKNDDITLKYFNKHFMFQHD